MKLTVDEIKELSDLLLSRLRETNGNIIELNNDYYWDISVEESFDLSSEPKEITVGQISFDLENIRNNVKNIDDTKSYDLIRLANILKAISTKYELNF